VPPLLALRPRALLTFACAASLAAAGCGGTPTGPDVEVTELRGARVPATVAPGTAFTVVGYYGHGACDQVTPVVEQTADGVQLALVRRVERTARPCTDILVGDSVVARVGPAATLPFTVRLRRRGGPDSVLVVRGS
jgi:hypothetical protein